MEGALMMRVDRVNHQNGYREVVIRVRVARNWPDCVRIRKCGFMWLLWYMRTVSVTHDSTTAYTYEEICV